MRLPIIVVPGTFWKDRPDWAQTYALENKPMQAVERIFGVRPRVFDWPGTNSARARHRAARDLANYIEELASAVHLLGFSHGGNVASEAATLSKGRVDTLITIATPVTGRYKTGGAVRHIHLYSPADRMQVLGGEGPFGLPARARRKFPQGTNVAIPNIPGKDMAGSHGDILWSDEAWRILETLH